MLAPKELRDIHPLGKSPVISVEGPSGASKVIAESGAIVEYISAHFGKHLVPKQYPEGKEDEVGAETDEWMRYRVFMHYAEGSIMPPLLIALSFMRMFPQPSRNEKLRSLEHRAQRSSSPIYNSPTHESYRWSG